VKRTALLLSVAVFCLCLGSTAFGADWPKWRGPDGTGISAETDWKPESLKGNPKIAWKTDVGAGYSAVSVKGGMVYTMGFKADKDTVHCLKEADGSKVWSHSYPAKAGSYPGPRCSPVLEGSLVWTISRFGDVFCLDAASGQVKWQKKLADFGVKIPRWGISCSPLIEGNTVVFNAGGTGVALDKNTGRKVWASGGLGGYATPVAFNLGSRRCLAIFSRKSLVVVDAAGGAKLASHPWQTSYDVNAADPIFSGGKMFISSGYNRGCALLDLTSGKPREVWGGKSMSNHFGTCVLIGGHLYGVTGNTGKGSLKCLEFATGKEKWSQKTGFGAWTAAGDKLIVLTERGQLLVAKADPGGYQEIARCTAMKTSGKCWTMPVLAGGKIYCRDSKGQLVCLDVSGG
jgi:outer membrane protein assembly factor BamB